MAVTGKRAISVMGGPELMVRALKHEQGKVGDLAYQKPIAEALKRVPAGSSVVVILSIPACAATLDGVTSEALLYALPAERREALRSVPLPTVALPKLESPTIFSLGVDGRTLCFQMDMPRSQMGDSVPYLRHLWGRLILFAFEMAPGATAHVPVGVMHEGPMPVEPATKPVPVRS